MQLLPGEFLKIPFFRFKVQLHLEKHRNEANLEAIEH